MTAIGIFRVEVTDFGVGFAADEHSRVFGDFAQFDRQHLQGEGNDFGL